MANGKKPGKPRMPHKQHPAIQRALTPEEVGRERGRVMGDPRFTPSEKAAAERVAKHEMQKALQKKAEARRRARRF